MSRLLISTVSVLYNLSGSNIVAMGVSHVVLCIIVYVVRTRVVCKVDHAIIVSDELHSLNVYVLCATLCVYDVM